MKDIDIADFISKLAISEQQEYKEDIAELKKRIWHRVILKPHLYFVHSGTGFSDKCNLQSIDM